MRGKQLAGATDQKLRVLLTYKGSARPVVRFRMITYLLIWRLTGDRSRQPRQWSIFR